MSESRVWKTPKGTELFIMDLRGKDYLQVQWRLVWFREEHPDWTIETSFLSMDAGSATAKAIISNAAGKVLSTAHKYEDKQGFADFREKAETGAVGRALAMLGYGTQFCADDLDEGERIADSPVDRKAVAQGPAPIVTPKTQHHKTQQKADCVCGTMLKLSEAKGVYYCPKFASPGEHSRNISKKDYEETR